MYANGCRIKNAFQEIFDSFAIFLNQNILMQGKLMWS